MTIAQSFLAELKHEANTTRKMLERVPFDQINWQPHEKSMALLRITQHIASLPLWIPRIIDNEVFNFTNLVYNPPVPENSSDLIKEYDKNIETAEQSLSTYPDEEIVKLWTLKRGDITMFTLLKTVAVRNLALNHLIHHRGQLSVYLRLLNVPVPGAYGPSADDIL
jgi:uncharacterized damage-inducible protein DinB